MGKLKSILFLAIIVAALQACSNAVSDNPDTATQKPFQLFSATASVSQVTLRWAIPADSNISKILICRDSADYLTGTSCTTNYQIYSSTDLSTTRYNDVNLVNNSRYYYSIFGLDKDNQIRLASTTFAVPSDSTAVADVKDFVITGSDKQIVLKWTYPSEDNISSVLIRRSKAPDLAPASPFDGELVFDALAETFTDAGLINGQTYHYTIFVQSNRGRSAGVTRSAYPKDDIAPNAVSNFVATNQSSTTIKLSWHNPNNNDFAAVKVYRNDASTDLGTTKGTIIYQGNLESTIDANLTTGATYYYTIFVLDTSSNRSLPQTASTQVQGDTTPPTVISVSPAFGTSLVKPYNPLIQVNFSEAIDISNTPNAITLADAVGNNIQGAVSQQSGNLNVVHFQPGAGQLALNTSYSASVSGDTPDLSGNVLGTAQAWTFSTVDGDWHARAKLLSNLSQPLVAPSTAFKPMAASNENSTIVVWREGGNIYSRFYHSVLGWDVLPTKLNTFTVAVEDPQVVMDSGGDATVVWMQNNGGQQNIYAIHHSETNGWDSAPVLLQDAATTTQKATAAALAVDAAGTVTVTWLQQETVDRKNLWVKRLDKSTAWNQINSVLLETDTGSVEDVSVAADSSGNAIVVWTQRLSSGGGMLDVYYKRYDALAANWDTNVSGPIDEDAQNDSANVTVRGDGQGNYIVAWSEAADWIGFKFYYFNNNTLGNLTTVNADPSVNSILDPALATNQHGDAVLLWSDGAGLYANVFRPSSGWSGASKLSSENVQHPAVSLDQQGNALLLWNSSQAINVYRHQADHPLIAVNVEALYFKNGLQPGNASVTTDQFGNASAVWSYQTTAIDGTQRYAAFANQFRFVEPGPDLSVSIDSVTTTQLGSGNNEVTLNYTVSNLGNVNSPASIVDIWVGDNLSPIAGLRGNQSIDIPALAVNQSLALNTTLPSSTSNGAVFAVVDPTNAITEKNEDDNISEARLWSLPANLTVVIDSVLVKSVVNGGSNLAITYTVSNNGFTASGNFSADIWGDLAAPPSAGTSGTNSVNMMNLLPGQSITKVASVSVAAAQGNAYVAIDNQNAISELDETDNIGSASWQTPANLVVSINSVSATPGTGSNAVDVSFVVTNQGQTASPAFTAGLWTNSNVVPGGGSIPDSTLSVLALAPGQSATLNANLQSSAGMGTAYVLVDINGIVGEYNEQDNLSQAVAWQLPANLVVSIDASSATTGASGNDVSLTYTVSNTGVSASGPFSVDFWSDLPAAPTLGTSGEATKAHATLAGGQSVTGSVVITSTLGSGSAYAIVDSLNTVAESNDADNISAASAWQLTTVTPPANLIVSIDSITATPGTGTNGLSISYTVTNVGSQASGNFNVDLWADAAQAPIQGNTGQLTVPHASLAASASISQTVSLSSGLGSATAYAYVDSANLVTESNEQDNLSSFAWQLPTNLAITVDAVTVTASTGSNSVNITYTVSNNGVKPSGTFSVDLWSNAATAPVLGNAGELRESHVSLGAGQTEVRTVTLQNAAASGTVYAIVDTQSLISESSKTDNIATPKTWTAPLLPANLVIAIDSVSAVPNQPSGSTLSITYTVTNSGSDASGSFQVDLWDNAAAAPTPSQLGISNVAHASLNGGQSITNTATISSAIDAGTAYVSVDAPGVVVESSDADNVSAGVVWQLPANLTVSIDSVSALPGAGGNDITINYTVNNVGASDSGVFSLGLWSHSTSAPATGNTPDASVSVASIAPGGSVSNSMTLSNTLGSGTAYVIVDIGNVVVESNELDNVVGKTWQLPANLSLVINSVSAMPGATTNSVSVTYTVSNAGVASAGAFSVDLWGDLAAAPSIGTSGDVREAHTALAGGASETRTSVLSTALTTGTAYAAVDSLQQVVESNETDNVSSGVSWKFPANLSVVIDSVSAVSTATDNLVTINYTVTNSGDSDAPAFNIDIWADAAAAPTASSIGDITISKPGLAAKQTVSGSIALQTVLGSGTAYVFVDSPNAVTESNETDNASAGATWQLPANLSVTLDSIDASVGNQVTINYTVSNLGVAASGAYVSAIWVDAAATPSAGATNFDSSESLLSLNQGQTDVRSITINTTKSSGMAYVSVDNGQVVSESNEGDNIVGLSWQRPANLIVSISGVSVTNTVNGNDVAISYSIENVGGTAAGAFNVGLWSDFATVPAITDTPELTPLYAGLAAGAVINDTMTITNVNTLGTAYVAVDTANVISEFDETDNVSAGVAWQQPVAQPPNLSVTIDSVTTAVAATGGYDVTINYTVSNTGLGQSGGFDLDLWVNAAAAPAVGAAGDISVNIANLLAQTSVTGSAIINTAAVSGTAYAVVDTLNAIAESDETDNVSLGSSWAVPVGNLPNLNITLDSVSAVASATAGLYDVTINYTVTNSGLDPSADFSVGVWSDYAVVPDTSAVPETTQLQTGLAGSASASKSITLQSSLTTGTAYVLADINDVVVEANETDNASLGVAWTVSASGMPDLSVSITQVVAQPVVTGGTDVTISYAVTNNDTVASGNFSLGVWSDLATAPVVNDVAESYISLTSLAGGASILDSVTVHTTATSGSAYLLVDPSNAIVESNETNNVSGSWAWFAVTSYVYNFENGIIPTDFSLFDNGIIGSWDIDFTNSGPTLPGVYSFVSPYIGVGNAACFEVTKANVQYIQFDLKIDALSNDWLFFYVDVPLPDTNNSDVNGSGLLPWTTWDSSLLKTPLTLGTHTFTWCYYDSNGALGRAWVDNIIIQ